MNKDLTTKLFEAIKEGNIPALKSLLLEEDINLNYRNSRGLTALQEAVNGGHVDAVRLFIENGCDVNFRGRYTYALVTMYISPLRRAVQHGQQEIVELLLDNGAKVEIADKDEYKGLLRDENEPLLFCAIDTENKEMVALVLKKIKEEGLSINEKDKKGRTPLSWAEENGYTEIAQMLLQYSEALPSYETATQSSRP